MANQLRSRAAHHGHGFRGNLTQKLGSLAFQSLDALAAHRPIIGVGRHYDFGRIWHILFSQCGLCRLHDRWSVPSWWDVHRRDDAIEQGVRAIGISRIGVTDRFWPN